MNNLNGQAEERTENVDIGINLDEDSDENSKVYTPQVSKELKPKKGQQFDTIDDVVTFYNAYAKAAGFSIRAWTTKKESESGDIKRKEFVCFKQGNSSRIVEAEKKRRRGSLSENCNAKIAVLKSNSEKYVVTVFNEQHSHPLSSPSKVHLLRSHRSVSAATKSLTKQLSMVNIPPHQQFSLLGVQSGGIENIGCTQTDLYNHARDMRVENKGKDGEMFYEYLELEKSKNPSFTYKIDVGEDKKITRCFWSDAISRRAYAFYGDVVIFDTTYNTNRYGMIFAPIMGVNNHGQTVIFACGFLNHESVDDFIWLFTNFLEFMPGGAPKMIKTDQDPAMAKAFPIVLPNTFHRYCSWHILMKFSEKIDALKYSIYKSEFMNCIWKSETPEEFDLAWESLIKKSGLQENKWLEHQYQLRSKWIPAYVNHIFSAGMSSSQRAESGHSFFKRFVSKGNSLVDFMIQFGRGLVRQRHEELMADHKDIIEKPKLKVNLDLLDQMVGIYTNEIYFKFESEVLDSFNYKLQLVREMENHLIYDIQRTKVTDSKVRKLVYDKDLDLTSCSCKMFESVGIPCKHIIAYLIKFLHIEELPNKYILKRWTKSAKSGIVIDDNGVHIDDGNSYLLIRSQFIQSSLDLVDKALLCEETKQMFVDGVRSINEQIEQFTRTRIGVTTSTEKNIQKGSNEDVLTSVHSSCDLEKAYGEPDEVRAKGCGKRLLGGKEKAINAAKNKKNRLCHGCGKVNQSHDKRNCPTIKNLSSLSDDNASLHFSGSTMEDKDDANLN